MKKIKINLAGDALAAVVVVLGFLLLASIGLLIPAGIWYAFDDALADLVGKPWIGKIPLHVLVFAWILIGALGGLFRGFVSKSG